jgi:hypothetical protein
MVAVKITDWFTVAPAVVDGAEVTLVEVPAAEMMSAEGPDPAEKF